MNRDAELAALKSRLLEIDDLRGAASVLHWDQATYMPPGGAESRGRQLALLSRIAHDQQADPGIGHLLDTLQPWAESQGEDSDVAALVRVTRRDYERATRVPSTFIERLSAHTTAAYHTWERARPANDFAAVLPMLEKTVEMSRELAAYHPGYEHPYDPLIDLAEDGMTVGAVRELFDELRAGLVPLIRAIRERPEVDGSCLAGDFPEPAQQAFGEKVIRAFGYDYSRGRQDKTAHPFMTKLGRGDVRITTRYSEDFLPDGLFSTLHEAGHAMYEQGVGDEHQRTILEGGASLGVHESQSRLWENMVGRSRQFWDHFFPRLQAACPAQLNGVTAAAFHAAINRVQPTLIRVEADEATYNLHIMLRVELELALIEGSLGVADLPEAWNTKMREYLGLTPPDDAKGVLQDIHWSAGLFGYFATYTLGNVIAAQLWERFGAVHPARDSEIGRGDFSALLSWLRTELHQHGRKFEPKELVERITGSAVDSEPYLRYLENKYSGN